MNLIGFRPRTAPGAAPGDGGTCLAAGGALGIGGWRFVARRVVGSDLEAGE